MPRGPAVPMAGIEPPNLVYKTGIANFWRFLPLSNRHLGSQAYVEELPRS